MTGRQVDYLDGSGSLSAALADWLVIFDCDGVLVESEPLESLAILDVARRYGYKASADEAASLFRGLKLETVRTLVNETLTVDLPPDFDDEVRFECRTSVDSVVKAPAGLLEVLDSLQMHDCVASSSPLDVVVRRLESAGLLRHFEGRLYSAYDVGSWKPDPGLFLHAAAACGAQPQRCIVVEDSEVGVQAGLAAGMTVVHFIQDARAAASPPQCVVIRSMTDLPSALLEIARTVNQRELGS